MLKPPSPPSAYTAVTTPSVVTVWSTSGDAEPEPWISAIETSSVAGGTVGVDVVVGSGAVVGPPDEFSGVGAAATKSAEFSSLSSPVVERCALRELLSSGAGAEPSNALAPP